MKSHKLIASIVVFKEFHDSNKDIYDILADFIRAGISYQQKWRFTTTEISSLLAREFGFSLPRAVIKTCLRKNLLKEGFLLAGKGEFSVKHPGAAVDPQFTQKYHRQKRIYRQIEETFLYYLNTGLKNKLNPPKMQELRQSIRNYLLGNDETGLYSGQISACILMHQGDEEFTRRLNMLKEGLVLYNGIRYTPRLKELQSWQHELIIYLDTEILFHFAAYNGSVYQEIFHDFYKMVQEINLKSRPAKNIRLCYHEETEKEVRSFFAAAQRIICGKSELNPGKTVMKAIINGCSHGSDVLAKQSNFYYQLKAAGIHKMESEMGDYEKILKINAKKLLQEFRETSRKNRWVFDEESCLRHLKIFAGVSLKRKGAVATSIENCRCILLSDNKFVIYMAKHPQLQPAGRIALATDLDYITDKFWFRLKKGLCSNSSKPRNFDIITRAQMVLSKHMNNNVNEKYNELKRKMECGRISYDEALELNCSLREHIMQPEEVGTLDPEESRKLLDEDSLEHRLRELEILKQKAKEGQKAIAAMKQMERLYRNRKCKKVKRKFRILAFAMMAGLCTLGISSLALLYVLIDSLRMPGDTILSISGLVITLLASLPIYTVLSYLSKMFRKWIKTGYKRKVCGLIKTADK